MPEVFDPRPFEQWTPPECAERGKTAFTRVAQYRGSGGYGTVLGLEVRCDGCGALWVAHALLHHLAAEGGVCWRRKHAEPGAAPDPAGM